ncbi:MAG TPA: HlyD family type I secretion periplasmic adaptor subunit [Sphingobium sp.]|uniref:HlyD family type I secretion periplasmic adaptor subunit n=1 Tax=Sphingobium sp. TaxID=1912891 RepID=UPI002ED035BF
MSNIVPLHLQDRLANLEPYEPEAGIRDKLRLAPMLMGGLLFGLVAAGGLIPIGGAVISPGQIGVEAHVKKISHPAGGTVAEIRVENGQHVRKGQVLLRLDDRVTGADASLSTMSVFQMLAHKARLEAEQLERSAIEFPQILTASRDPAAARAMADERRMFGIKRAEQGGLVAQLKARIGQYEDQISGYRAQIASLHQQRTLIEPERAGVRMLYEKKLVTLNRLNQLERTAVDLNGSIGALTAQIAQARAQISETREQILQLGQTRRSEAGDQLNQINEQLNQQQVRSVNALDTQDRTLIRAPYDGVVEKFSLSTIGGVIRPADIIMEIVPDEDGIQAEGSISPSEIDRVHVGQPARIRLSGLSTAAAPEVEGRVDYVASDRVTDPATQRSYFPIRVTLDPKSVAKQTSVKLKPGMPADIYVETGNRSMLSYITKPLREQFARAFRD